MGDLLIPPWLRISATEPAFVSNTAGGQSIFSGAVRTTESAGDKVGVRISTANASGRESDPNRAFLESHLGARRGQGGRIWYTPAGYTIRGSLQSFELLPNNTFADGTTQWSSNNSDTVISAVDRILRMKRARNTDVPTVLNSSATAAALYAPYVARAFMYPGRGPTRWDIRIRDISDSSAVYATTATSQTVGGMLTCSGVVRDTDITIGIIDRSTGKIAGDFMDIAYASLARCALVDNGPNLLLQSDEFDTSWIATRASVDDQTAGTTAPDGTSTADSIIEDATAAQSHLVSQIDIAVSASAADYSFGVALKAGSRNWVMLRMTEATGGTVVQVFFNLTTGAIGTLQTGVNWANGRMFIVPLGDGWHGCYLVARKTNAATSLQTHIFIGEADNDAIYDGNGTGNIYAWRATLAQSSVPTRLVLTTTTTLPTGTLQTGLGLHLKGLPASTDGLLRYGAWVQTGKQLAKVVARLDSDAAGLGYLQLAYPPRTQPPDNDPLIVHEPFGRFVATENRVGWQERPGIFADFELDLIEALDS